MSAGEGGAGQGDHRYPHQQGFAGGQAAGVGPRVQGDIDAVVGVQEGGVIFRAFQAHTLAHDTPALELFVQGFAEIRVAVLGAFQE